MTRRFALVDRDGTINVERDHITDPGQIELIPGSAEALVRLREEVGMGIVIVTNQAHVGRGERFPGRGGHGILGGRDGSHRSEEERRAFRRGAGLA